MPPLPPAAVDILYPVLAIIALVVVAFVTLITGLWRGFRWLEKRVEKIAQAMLAPIAKDVAAAQASTKKAHKRISRIRSELNLKPDHMDEYETDG